MTAHATKDQAINLRPLPCTARLPPGTCKNRSPMKKIPAAKPAIDDVIPNSASIPPGMAKLILTRSINEIIQAINIGVITRNQRALGILLSIVNTSMIQGTFASQVGGWQSVYLVFY